MPTVPPIALTAVAAAGLLYGLTRIAMLRLRTRRHRRFIRADLEQRKCQYAVARRRRGRLLARVQTYDIEYVDPDRDTVSAVCTIDGKTIKWSEADGVPGIFNLLVPTLPDHGQNWRG